MKQFSKISNGVKHPTLKTLDKTISATKYFPEEKRVTLIDALDRVLEKGAVLDGELAVRVADIDLIFIGLRLLITSISKAEELRTGKGKIKPSQEDIKYIQEMEQLIEETQKNLPKVIDAKSPKTAEKGIAKLVLTLVELIRQLIEREARRQIRKNILSQVEIEKLGLTLKALEKKIEELKAVFGIEDEELNLDLGPLGNLM